VPRTEDGKVDWSRDFFGKPTNLTVSGQLEAENFAMAFGDVYTFGPTFRAEDSNTPATPPSSGWSSPRSPSADLNDDMDLAEDMLKYVIRDVMEQLPARDGHLQPVRRQGPQGAPGARGKSRLRPRELHRRRRDARKAQDGTSSSTPFPGAATCRPSTSATSPSSTSAPTFVTDYPKEIKAFYMRLNDDGKTVAAADCLCRASARSSAARQREERSTCCSSAHRELGLMDKEYKYYLDLRRYGGCQHAGFGLGFERLVMYLTGIDNIRDVLPHPRTTGSAEF
jgi:asparaginyl-tRNA synthetase